MITKQQAVFAKIILVSVAGLLSLSAFSVIAQETTSGSTDTDTTKITKIKAKAGEEIDRRITAMNRLISRLSDMQKLSAADKNTLTNELQSQISSLQALKTKIESLTDETSLRTEVKAITDSYRVFALIMPRDNIIAAADRLATIVTNLGNAVIKIQTRLNDPRYSDNDLTEINSTLAGILTNLTNANAKAQEAINRVVPLVPDKGDKTVMASNLDALKKSRADLKDGRADIVDALKDIQTIRKALNKLKVNASLSGTSATTSTSTGQ